MPEILLSGAAAISGSGFEFHYGDTCVPFAVFPKAVGFYILYFAQMVLYCITKGAGSLSVHNAHGGKMGQIGVIQVSVSYTHLRILLNVIGSSLPVPAGTAVKHGMYGMLLKN